MILGGSLHKGASTNNSSCKGSLREGCEGSSSRMVRDQLPRIHEGEMEASAGWLRNVHPRIIPSPSHEAHSLVQTQDATTSLNEHLNSNYCSVQFINMLLNTDHVSRRAIIIKLVSHNDIHTCIEEVMSSKPIESQATFDKAPVKWEDFDLF